MRENPNSHTTPTSELQSEASFKIHNVETAAVKRALQKLAAKTAVGVDNVPITVFKGTWSLLALPLVHVVNLVIRTVLWP